jgi:hypothetical protein
MHQQLHKKETDLIFKKKYLSKIRQELQEQELTQDNPDQDQDLTQDNSDVEMYRTAMLNAITDADLYINQLETEIFERKAEIRRVTLQHSLPKHTPLIRQRSGNDDDDDDRLIVDEPPKDLAKSPPPLPPKRAGYLNPRGIAPLSPPFDLNPSREVPLPPPLPFDDDGAAAAAQANNHHQDYVVDELGKKDRLEYRSRSPHKGAQNNGDSDHDHV